jgi:tRNA A37 threonylcarbamoyltransferase TsaD
VKAIKEDNLDLTRSTDDKIRKALHIYYDKLIDTLVEELHRAVARSQKLPRTDKPLPLVLAGGTAMPKGFRDRFEQTLRKRTLPFEIGDVRLAKDPLTATARGTLVAALAER